MDLVKLDNVEISIGLEWNMVFSPSSDVSEKKALSEYFSKNKGHSSGVLVRYGGFTLVGRSSEKKNNGKGTFSGAALLALANQAVFEQQQEILSSYSSPSQKAQKSENTLQESDDFSSDYYNTAEEEFSSTESSGDSNWIFIDHVDSVINNSKNNNTNIKDLFWMCVVKNGVPIPGGDLVGKKDDLINEALEILNTSDSFTVFTNDKDVRYNVIGQSTVDEKKFSDIIRGVDTKKAKISLFSFNKIVSIAVIAFIVLLGISWWGYSSWYTSRQEEQARQKAMVAAKSRQQKVTKQTTEYKSQVKNTVYKALDDGMNNLKNSLLSPSPEKVMSSWLKIIYNVNLYQAGWDINGISCGVDENRPFCTVLLKSNKLSTTRLLLNLHPDAEIKDDKATYTIYNDALKDRNFKISHIDTQDKFDKGLFSNVQELNILGMKHDLSSSSEILKTVTLPPPPSLIPQILQKKEEKTPKTYSIKLGYAQGDMKLEGNQFWQLPGLSRELNKNNISMDSFIVNVNGNDVSQSQWRLKINYYLHTSKNPVFPQISFDNKSLTFELPDKYKNNSF